ncbi:MAG: MBL fold metallo-hydrolase [Gammaproteobacteria bacterium]|nr:MBL fold metallo-hydrolase [Gammaproteobacteria bacterium]
MAENTYSQDLGDGITLIDAQYHRPRLAGCYLLQQGEEVAIIESGTAYTLPHLQQVMRDKGIAPQQVRYIIPTHVHLDHAGGVGQLLAWCPQAKVVVHPYGSRHLIDPQKLIAGTIAVYGEENYKRLYRELQPVAAARVMESRDGQCLDLAGRQLQLIDAPGHARHHHLLWDEQSQGLFSGDTFGLGYPELRRGGEQLMILPTTPVQFDPDAWRRTLQSIMTLQPKVIYLTHFGAVEDPTPLQAQLLQQIDDYVALATRGGEVSEMQAELFDYFYRKVVAMGLGFERGALQQLIGPDLGLCAQGLQVWRAREEG